MKRHLLLLIALALSAVAARGQETPTELAARLGSRSYAERERAAKKLEALGKSALPALKKALTLDLETKRRAEGLIEKIENRLLVEDALAATPIRLQFRDVPLEEALREADRRLDLRLGLPLGKTRVTVDTGALPYWQAWRRFREAAGLHESDFAQSAAKLKRMNQSDVDRLLAMLDRREFDIRAKHLMPRVEFAAAPSPYAEDDRGSVRVRVRWHSLDAEGNAVFAIEVRPEPRLQLATVPKAEILKIVDAAGRPCAVKPISFFPDSVAPENASFLASYVGEIQYGGLLQLRALAWTGTPRTLMEVHGRVRMSVIVKPKMLAMRNVVKSVGKSARGDQGISVKILGAEPTEDAELQIRLRLDHLESLAPKTDKEKIVRVRPGVIAVRGPMDVALERLELLDPFGRKCPLTKSSYEQLDGGAYEAVMQFAMPTGSADDLTLVMTKAARTLAVDAPFVVRDVVWNGNGSK